MTWSAIPPEPPTGDRRSHAAGSDQRHVDKGPIAPTRPPAALGQSIIERRRIPPAHAPGGTRLAARPSVVSDDQPVAALSGPPNTTPPRWRGRHGVVGPDGFTDGGPFGDRVADRGDSTS